MNDIQPLGDARPSEVAADVRLPEIRRGGDGLDVTAEAADSEIADSHLRWSVRRVIELLDAAIDRVGTQLAQTSVTPIEWHSGVSFDESNWAGSQASGRTRRLTPAAASHLDDWEPPDHCGPEL